VNQKLISSRAPEVRALTGIRGLAALYVVCFHVFIPIPTNWRIMAHGYIAVDLFFMLSGFVMAMNYGHMFQQHITLRSCRIFFSRRFARIYPLYLLTLLLAFLLVLTGHLQYFGSRLRTDFVANLFLVQNWGWWVSLNVPSWSISAEWFSYLLFPALLPLALHRRRHLPALMGVTIAVALVLLVARDKHAFFEGSGPLSVLRCVLEFTLGLLLFRIRHSRLAAALRQPVSGYLLAAALLLLLRSNRLEALVLLLFPPLILALDQDERGLGRFFATPPLEALGLHSYSIYLLHWDFIPIMNGLDAWLRTRHLPHSHTVAVATTFPLLLVASWLTFRLVENPGRALLRRLLEPMRNAPSRPAA